MAIVFALLTALSNAVSVTTQHIASTTDPRRSSGWRLVLYLFRNPLWLFGWVALAGAFLFQALALHNGLISVVQPLLVTELIFALVLRRFWIHQSILLVTWGGAALTCVGLAVFLVAGEPRGGQATPASHHWIAAGATCVAGTAVLAALAQWGSPGRRAALYASAAATMWALVAVFIKTTTDTLTQFGVGGMFRPRIATEVARPETEAARPVARAEPFVQGRSGAEPTRVRVSDGPTDLPPRTLTGPQTAATRVAVGGASTPKRELSAGLANARGVRIERADCHPRPARRAICR